MSFRCAAVAALAVVVLVSVDAFAAKPYELSYVASPGCPSEAEFRADVVSRVENAQAADGARLAVRIEARKEGFVGEIVVHDAAGGTGRRSIEGATCLEVAGALAFLTGLAIDLGGHIQEVPTSQPPRPPKKAESPRPAAVVVKKPPPPRAFSLLPVVGSVIARGGVRMGFGGEIAPSAEVALSLGSSGRGWFAPRIELSALFARGIVERAEGGAELVLFTSRLSGCPVRLGVETLGVRPCAGIEIGGVYARGVDVARPLEETRLWLAPEVVASLEWRFATRFLLELAGGPSFPALRSRYFFAPDTPVYTFPQVAARATMGIGVVF